MPPRVILPHDSSLSGRWRFGPRPNKKPASVVNDLLRQAAKRPADRGSGVEIVSSEGIHVSDRKPAVRFD